VLYGREAECALIDSLIARAADARSGALVLRGEPGIGKSALLDYAAENRASCHLLRGEGVESEVQLPYAALHQLLYPVLDRVDSLPALQSVALRSAFGLAPVQAPDRFLVAVAALTLMSDLAADMGLVCLVELITQTGGNPLALLELPSVLTPAELAGEHALPEPLPAGRQIELAFAAMAGRLDAGTQSLLLVTAAEETGDLSVVLRAAGMLGAPSAALDRAERAGLLRVRDNTVNFRHPLARSAIYQHATFAARRAAHERWRPSCTASRRWTGVPGTWLRPRSNRTLSLLQRWRLQPIELVDGLVHLLRRRPWNAARRSLPRTP
jgi:AAA ATPase domain